MIRTVWVYLVGGVATFFYAGMAVLRTYLWRRDLRNSCDRAARNWGKALLWAAGVKVVLSGTENLETDSPQIVISNHQSWFDVFAMAAHLPVRYRFVAKKELAAIPIFGRAWTRCGHVSVDRGNRVAAVESLDQAWREVHEERLTMVIFPEGTRSLDGELKRFKKGAFVLALQARVPIVPAGISGSREIMAKGEMGVRPGTIRIRIGKSIPTDALTVQDRDQLMEECWRAVQTLMGEEQREGHPGSEENLSTDLRPL